MRKLLLDAVGSTAFALAGKPAPEFSHNGKQVLRRSQHFADAASPEIAEALVHVLNAKAVLPDVPERTRTWVERVLWS